MAVHDPGSKKGRYSLATTQTSLCIVLRPAQAGDYIARHLPAITDLVKATDRQLNCDLGRSKNGECHVLLPHHYCVIRAQALAERLNGLCDGGRPVLEAEISSQTETPRRAGFRRQPAPENT